MTQSFGYPNLDELPSPPISHTFPLCGPAFERPDPDLIARMQAVGSATASATLHKIGVTQTFMEGVLPRTAGARICGTAVTLQFMPKREDIIDTRAEEGAEMRTALWAVFEAVQPGDVLVIQAYGSLHNGCVGEMLSHYFFKTQQGAGMVIDGAIRDWPKLRPLELPFWTRGFTPNYASQGEFIPWAYNVPVACSKVTVLPGDIIIADDDGAVCVPANLAPLILESTVKREGWEQFSRMKMQQGGALSKYYPLNDKAQIEYAAWRKEQGT